MFKKDLLLFVLLQLKTYICNRNLGVHVHNKNWRGAGVVTEQIANLSTGNRRQGSNPCLSALKNQMLSRILENGLALKFI